ncbi:MAG: N-acetylglucosamine-6-phosphate deacetylase [Armatimonadota bacterium]
MAHSLVITHAVVVLPNGIIQDGDVVCEKGVIAWVGPHSQARAVEGACIIDAAGRIVFPGLIDTHIHGAHGFDVMLHGEEGVRQISTALLRYGVTAWLPTTLSAPHQDLLRVIRWCRDAVRTPGPGARPLGIHVEGPYINPNKKGAQPPDGIRPPDLDECRVYLEESDGTIKLFTLAPELPKARELITLLRDRGIAVSLGHSEADYDTAVSAVRLGACHATHLFNAMPPIHHRNPGLTAACINEPEVAVELIADGVHLHPQIVRMAVKAKGFRKTILVTDAMSAAGMPDGVYTLGAHTVRVKGDLCTLPDGTIASSMLTMNRAVRNTVAFAGVSLSDAAVMASLVPAEVCGVSGKKGSIEVGKDADLAIMDGDFAVWATVVGGEVAYQKE